MHKKRESNIALCALVVCAAAGMGCDDDYVEGSIDPAIRVCETANVVGTEVAAGETQATGPEVSIADVPYDVALPSGAAGFVTFETEEEMTMLVFTKEAGVASAIFHGTDEHEELTPTGSNRFCASDVAELFEVELHEAGAYAIELGPTATNSARLWLVQSTGAASHHEEEEPGHAH